MRIVHLLTFIMFRQLSITIYVTVLLFILGEGGGNIKYVKKRRSVSTFLLLKPYSLSHFKLYGISVYSHNTA